MVRTRESGCLRVVVLVASVGAITFAASRDAEACSTIRPPPALVGFPSDGATDVPTDVVAFYDMTLAHFDVTGLPDMNFVIRSAAGAEIGATAQKAYAWQFELTPMESLEPNTEYILETTLPAYDGEPATTGRVAFTTGAGPLSAAPEAPTGVFLQHYRINRKPLSSCDPHPSGTCLALPAGAALTATYTWQEEEQSPSYLLEQPLFIRDLSGINQGTPFECINLRTRAANGTLSPPTTLCGAGAPLFELGDTDIACTPDGLTLRGQLASEMDPGELAADPDASSEGCSLTPRRPCAPLAFTVLLVGLGLLGRARRRAR